MRNTAGLSNTGPDAQGVVNNSSCNRRLLKGQDTPSLLAHQQLHLCQEPLRNSGGSFQRYKPSFPNKDSRPLFILFIALNKRRPESLHLREARRFQTKSNQENGLTQRSVI